MISRKDAQLGAGILFVLINLVFFPFLWGGGTMMSAAAETASIYVDGAAPRRPVRLIAYKELDPGAASWQTEAEFYLEHRIESHGGVPLWNPYVGFGQPLAANMISQPYYPLTPIVTAHPSPRTYNWYIALRFYFAALFALLYLGYFVRLPAALGGAAAFAFTGYLVLYYDIAHISVEALLPALLWGVERLVRRRDANAIGTLALVSAAVVFGGMPESAFLAFAFAAAYAVVRLVGDAALARRERVVAGARLAAGFALGAVASAVAVLPFLEFVRNSANQHIASNVGGYVVGLTADVWDPRFMAPYLAPLIYGPPWNNIFNGFSGHSGVRGYWGVAVTYLALLAIGSRIVERVRARGAGWSPEAFFAVAAALLLLKRFGVAAVEWIGTLPGFALMYFPKYDEALIGMSMAALAAFGIERLVARRASRVAIVGAAAAILGALTVDTALVKPAFQELAQNRYYLHGALLWALLVLAVSLAIAWWSLRARSTRYAGEVAAALVALDLLACYFVPMWYVINEVPPRALDPGRGAPFVAFLQRETARDRARFLGLDGLLYPEWSAAFGLADVRDLNALYVRGFLPFVRTFLGRTKPMRDELVDRFTATGIARLDDPLAQRFLTLASVRFVATRHDPNTSAGMLDEELSRAPEKLTPQIRIGSFTIGAVTRRGVFMHPPLDGVPVDVDVPRGVRALLFSFGEDSGAYVDEAHLCGDGVGFTVAAREGSGRSVQLFHRYIDPKHVVAQRRWFDGSADVARFAGRRVTLSFQTDAGPARNTCADWAVWGPMRFDGGAKAAASPFSTVFDTPDAQVVRYADPLPRVALYTRVVAAADDDGALRALAAPRHDVHRVAVVTLNGPDARRIAADLAHGSDAPVTAAAIDSYEPGAVRATVDAPARGLAVLNDTDYPGWTATVDGTPAAVVRANGLFRGIEVPAGRHVLEFRYAPRSFAAGAALTATGLAGSAGLLLFGRRRRTVRDDDTENARE